MLFCPLLSLLFAVASVAAAPAAKHHHNAYVDGRLFKINGKTQYFAGTNTWYLGYLQDAVIDTVVSQLAATPLLVTRVWGFGNVNSIPTAADTTYYQILNSTGGYINHDIKTGIGRLDAVVAAAEKHKVKIVLALLNNWDDLGGINTYTNAFGGNATSFYTDAKSQAAYRNYIRFIVNRYKHSSAIFSWELCNEPRCRSCPPSTIYDWASSTSAYIKSLDPTHMVTLGDEGWISPTNPAPMGDDGSYAYSGLEGVDFVKNLEIKTLDYGTFHLYPTSWGYNASWGLTWLAQHDAMGAQAAKPVVAEEYGWLYANNRTVIDQSWQDFIVQKSGIAYDSFWEFSNDIPPVKNEVDAFAISYNTTIGSDYDLLAIRHGRAMLGKQVGGGYGPYT